MTEAARAFHQSIARQLDAATPETALSIADAWREVSTACADLGGTLGKPAGELNHDLSGDFGDAFEDYARSFAQAGNAVSRALADGREAVRTAATQLANTKAWLKSRCEWLLDSARGTSTGDRRGADAAIRALCEETATEIRQVLTTCTTELETALTTLRRAAEDGKAITKLANPSHAPAVFTLPIASAPTPISTKTRLSPAVLTKPVVADWVREALSILSANGTDVSGIDPAQLYAMIQHESGGDPHAINNWDSNAAAGHPSKGLMQTIDSTFSAYRLDGHGDIWNPVDNIVAAVRYAIARYGSISQVPGVAALTSGGGYVGY